MLLFFVFFKNYKNNNNGGGFIYPINFLWQIGKNVYEKKDSCLNVIEKYSIYLSYFYGNSYFFTRENIHFMKKFYLSFPIYYDKLNDISWNQYRLLLFVNNKEERYFYFYLILLFKSDYLETLEFVNNNYFYRI